MRISVSYRVNACAPRNGHAVAHPAESNSVKDRNGDGNNAEVTFSATYTLTAAARGNFKALRLEIEKALSFETYQKAYLA